MTPLNPHLQSSSQTQTQGKVKVVAGYALQQRLGSGSFATVYKGVKVSSDGESTSSSAKTVAVKAITRTSEKLTKKVLENLEMEISILRTYHHPNIVCLHEVQKTERHFYLILEYCGGGDVQRLIRTRKSGRLSERLTRRLMRDLASGLRFLWGQELIHRDIKPQNLLLTGPLPLDELNDPAKMDVHEELRRQTNFPSSQFALKIADFGFARHLQTASLAETLCGSPLYMAPEILQHHRYDAKADLWSVGTVLFEMIAGRPPFNGENHIDLLRNIQRKAVRLPADVRVSRECVTLLRLLLQRNPLSRAGFKEFFEACEAFCALGCEGVDRGTTSGTAKHSDIKMDLGTIQEVDAGTTHGAASMLTVATQAHPQTNRQEPRSSPEVTPPQPGLVTPPMGPIPSPANGPPTKISAGRPQINPKFAPLQPSPPQSSSPSHFLHMGGPVVPVLEGRPASPGQIQLTTYQNSNSVQASQNSSDDSEFVMVEHGNFNRSGSLSPAASTAVISPQQRMPSGGNENTTRRYSGRPLTTSPPSSPRYLRPSGPSLTPRGEYLLVNESRGRHVPRGMLSTSPGTGVALVGMTGRPRLLNQSPTGNLTPSQVESQIASATNMIAAAEDVGRRGISVAHLGDTRAYLAMRLIVGGGCGSSLFSTTPMEGVEEETDEDINVNNNSGGGDGYTPTAETSSPNRQRAVSGDRSMTDVKPDDDEEEEMPFAVSNDDPQKDATTMPIPSRSSTASMHKRSSLTVSKPSMKASPEMIRSHFGEALSCYLKALSMLKSILGAVQRLKKDISGWNFVSGDQRSRLQSLTSRCDVTSNWLSGQFRGVLERADAANTEISKQSSTASSRSDGLPVVCVEELIYNHSLACGRDGAVKQLLGQFDAARSCYRTAGLLAETLLMEPNIGKDDRVVLEGYVDGFAARIVELDEMMLQQSRSIGGNSVAQKRGSGVIPIIGGIPPPTGFPGALPPFQLGGHA